MKYKEALEKYEDSQKLKVGSLQSFFYVGTVGDFRDNIKEVSGKLFIVLKDRTERKRQEYETRLENPPTIKDYCRYEEGKAQKYTVENYLAYLNQWLETTQKRLIGYQNAKEREANFVPLEKRNVKSIRESSAIDPNCVILVLEGRETGRFWTTDEAEPGSVSIGSMMEAEG